MDKQIGQYGIIDYGVDHEQYFPGCGTSFTNYTDVATGIGNSAREAADDAAEQLAMNGWDTSALDAAIMAQSDVVDVPENSEEMHHYVSIRVREVTQ